ncbi:three-Cys-motif partner protein TcmP [Sphingomonas nostoxanthinifaciens]|uniref:three-Cys-motif partner protein TcmP n=1 Tax=Sphingomonas nostoxanthinifaciens TaxID=2872652 RepID=UPI001CC20453|nr:three-Cys-motif partner protein TcmP [Sphingomonas nostoxanthinifaciens]UAK23643.1 three-Cys-motif partner protein TcmP [Sphingomonas nostoxanthinifaciens]
MPHRYGGAWTELKLDVVEGYLRYYTDVLKAAPSKERPFKLWYVDAFAGSGSRTTEIITGGIFENRPASVEEVELAGSARRALNVEPPFHKLVFIEGDAGRFADLDQLRIEYPDRDIECLHGEANKTLKAMFQAPPWSKQPGGRGGHRAVVFLDPYGMSVQWDTLEELAKSGSADVWYLFPVEGINRQLSDRLEKVDRAKQLKLDEIFGTKEWRGDLYKEVSSPGLFEEEIRWSVKTITKSQVETYGLRQFGKIFRYVAPPTRLSAKGRGHVFSLICLSNSESNAAIGLISKGVAWLRKSFG